MSAISSIEWCDRTWNPVRGCSIVSAGCHNCYAMKQAHRFSGAGRAYEGLTKKTKSGPQWTGKITLVPESLNDPMTWRKPERIFVNSMSDLFHESIPDEFIGQVLNAILWAGKAHGHTFQVLTKRPARMLDCMRRYYAPGGLNGTGNPSLFQAGLGDVIPWLQLGVSFEDQPTADERIPLLLQTPAAAHFVSGEPLLQAVTLLPWLKRGSQCDCGIHRGTVDGCEPRRGMIRCNLGLARLSWVIVGGESGPGARACDLAWIRSIVQECQAAAVPPFVKQVGSAPYDSEAEPAGEFSSFTQWVNKASSWLGGVSGGGRRYKPKEHVVCIDAAGRVCRNGGDFRRADESNDYPIRWHEILEPRHSKGGDPAEWSEDLRVRQFPAAVKR